MKKDPGFLRGSHRGGVLIATLAYVAIVGMVIAGILSLTISHYSRARVESDYSNALAVAEAGINYELNKISVTPANADQSASPYTQSLLDNYSQAAGSFTVYVTPRTGTTVGSGNWTSPNDLFVFSTGTVNGVSRTVRVGAKSYDSLGGGAQYAVFGVAEGIANGSPTIFGGSVGTDGGPSSSYGVGLTFNGHPTVNGSVVFAGPGAGWQNAPYDTVHPPSPLPYTEVHKSAAEVYQTVDQIATAQFGTNPYTYLTTHNDNSLAVPPITSQTALVNSGTLTFTGKAGGANYYLTNLTLNGSSKVAFNNTNGPITIWFGPSGTAGNTILSGGTATVKMATNPNNLVKIYVATTNDVILNGSDEMDFGLYDYNGTSSGRVLFNGNPTIYGSIISEKFTFNNNPIIYYTSGYFGSSGTLYFGAIDSWRELGGAN